MVWLNQLPTFVLIVGLLVPTVIHVFVFTILFMLYGVLRSNSIHGYISVGLGMLCPVIIGLWEIDPKSYNFPDFIKEIFVASKFHISHVKLTKFFGLSDGKAFFFYSVVVIKFQIFIAFIYLYHYLNWFSKTTVIGWHKQLTKKNAIVIVGLWLLAMGLHIYDYSTGVLLVLSLSLLHVVLEFPLNIVSIKGIGEIVISKVVHKTRKS